MIFDFIFSTRAHHSMDREEAVGPRSRRVAEVEDHLGHSHTEGPHRMRSWEAVARTHHALDRLRLSQVLESASPFQTLEDSQVRRAERILSPEGHYTLSTGLTTLRRI